MTSAPARHYSIELPDVTFSFIPFGLLLGAALLLPENAPDPTMARTVYTIWVTTVLVTPALCAFALPGSSPHKRAVWLLFWSFAFAAYVVHALYAYFGVYGGSFQRFLTGQGVLPAIVNVVFTLWWTLDVLLAWLHDDRPKWVRVQRVAAHIFIGLTFFASAVILKRGFINVLGAVMTAAVIVWLLIRHAAPQAAGVKGNPAMRPLNGQANATVRTLSAEAE